MNFKKITKLPLVLILLMVIVGAIIYSHLPPTIPIHWNIAGRVDAWASKSILSVFMIPLISMGLYLLFLLAPKIDPLAKNYKKFGRSYNLIIDFTVAFFTFVFALVLISSFSKDFKFDVALNVGLGLLFIVLGNQFSIVRKNWFFGIRVPWTLASEVVWNKTHRLGAKIFVAAGFIMIPGAFSSRPFNALIAISAIFSSGIIVTVYSYIIFKQVKDKSS